MVFVHVLLRSPPFDVHRRRGLAVRLTQRCGPGHLFSAVRSKLQFFGLLKQAGKIFRAPRAVLATSSLGSMWYACQSLSRSRAMAATLKMCAGETRDTLFDADVQTATTAALTGRLSEHIRDSGKMGTVATAAKLSHWQPQGEGSMRCAGMDTVRQRQRHVLFAPWCNSCCSPFRTLQAPLANDTIWWLPRIGGSRLWSLMRRKMYLSMDDVHAPFIAAMGRFVAGSCNVTPALTP